MNPAVKIAVEMGPLLAFFATYLAAGLMPATAVLMAAVAAALAISVWLEGRLPVMPLVTAGVVLVFGGLTLALADETFIKMKPTIINGLFAAALLGGLAAGRPLLPYVLGTVFQLDGAGWSKLSLRWAMFFVSVAVLNELVWRSFSTDTWVSFKVFGILPLTLVFALAQTPLIRRHAVGEDAGE